MRFNSAERFEAFRSRREYPKIHDDIFELISNKAEHTTFCDLCCSTGLLGQRLVDAGMSGFGVDADRDTLLKAKEAGVSILLYFLRVEQKNLPTLRALFEVHKPRVLVARRCFSEIFHPHNWGVEFSTFLRDSGIRQVFLQGRRAVKKPTHPIHSIQQEIACIRAGWDPVVVQGECAYLKPLV